MAVKSQLRLGTEQSLQQGLSPLQVRYGRLLEMTGAEVEEAVRAEIDDNPALELREADELTPAPFPMPHGAAAYDLDEARVVADSGTLADYLESQLAEVNLAGDERTRLIAGYVIGSLDTNGYLTRGAAAIATDMAVAEGTDVEPAEVQQVIDVIRTLEPAGVGATSLRDCLMMQLQRVSSPDATQELALRIVDRHFDLLSRMHWDRMHQALGVSREELTQAVARIRSLNPKPGSSVGMTEQTVIAPDFYVQTSDDGDVQMTVLNGVPELQLSASFAPDPAEEEARTRSTRVRTGIDFIRSKRGEAEAFMRVIKMRQQTLFDVMSAIIRLQHRFFVTEDPADLRPMVIRDVAEISGYDPSVISRSTAAKYVATPTAIYPLKYFFNEAPMADREEVSRHAVIEALRALIEGEETDAPLSDDALAAALSEQGFGIARRTVAKYREQMGIPVARLRRQL